MLKKIHTNHDITLTRRLGRPCHSVLKKTLDVGIVSGITMLGLGFKNPSKCHTVRNYSSLVDHLL